MVQDAETRFEIAETWAIGDLVGYGPHPAECLSRLNAVQAISVAGNHDLAVVSAFLKEVFNRLAAAAVSWTQSALDDTYLGQFMALPEKLERHDITLLYGSPRDRAQEYVTDQCVAARALNDTDTTGLAVGHTHIPEIFQQRNDEIEMIQPALSRPHSIAGSQFLVNPGSVEQPRDGDPRASYAVLDLHPETVTH